MHLVYSRVHFKMSLHYTFPFNLSFMARGRCPHGWDKLSTGAELTPPGSVLAVKCVHTIGIGRTGSPAEGMTGLLMQERRKTTLRKIVYTLSFLFPEQQKHNVKSTQVFASTRNIEQLLRCRVLFCHKRSGVFSERVTRTSDTSGCCKRDMLIPAMKTKVTT